MIGFGHLQLVCTSANCGLYCGARIDFVDIDEKTITMCTTALKNKLAKVSEKSIT